MRVHVVDPPAYTPPYDRALCAALAAAGADVTLVTSAFRHGDVPPARGYTVDERFYRGAEGRSRALQHVPDMLAYALARRRAAPDVTHWQWASIQEVDWRLLGRGPHVLTAHDVLPRVARPLQHAGQRRLYARMDAIVVHTAHGRERLIKEAGVDPARVHVVPHGAFTHLGEVTPVAPPELAARTTKQAVLFFGLIKPYKGLDVLYDAWRRADPVDAELWVVGAPRMALPLPPPGVRVVPRFVTDAEAAWCLRQAALTVLPYRDIEMSGVLFTALGLGRPLLLSDVGGFPEVTAAAHVPPGDPEALATELSRLLADAAARDALARAAAGAARTTYAWDAIAGQHLALYEAVRAGA